MECSICCETFNKSSHLKVDCKGCNGENFACRTCCQTYILKTTNENPSCLFCKSPWERDFMNEYLTKKFVNKDLKNHIENIYLDQQVSLLPETQKDAKKEKNIRCIKLELEKANVVLNQIKKAYSDQIDIIKSYNLTILRLRSGEQNVEDSKGNFTFKCKVEKCNGFLDCNYTCQLCDEKFCKKCMEIKKEDHECDEDLVASVEIIKKQAKPCPSCGEMISKIDGCDQMWCVKCHVQFSWRTGQQLTGYNHNPEYFKWLRETNQKIERNPYDERGRIGNCLIDDRTLYRNIVSTFGSRKEALMLEGIIRFFRHIEFSINNENFQRHTDIDLKNLRIKFLLNDITKNTWKVLIQKIYKLNNKQKDFSNVRRLIFNVLQGFVERIHEIQRYNKHESNYYQILKEAENFRLYANSQFIKICDTYGASSCPGILENWRESYNLKKFIKRTTVRQ